MEKHGYTQIGNLAILPRLISGLSSLSNSSLAASATTHRQPATQCQLYQSQSWWAMISMQLDHTGGLAVWHTQKGYPTYIRICSDTWWPTINENSRFKFQAGQISNHHRIIILDLWWNVSQQLSTFQGFLNFGSPWRKNQAVPFKSLDPQQEFSFQASIFGLVTSLFFDTRAKIGNQQVQRFEKKQ